jgi:hypothetical protein
MGTGNRRLASFLALVLLGLGGCAGRHWEDQSVSADQAALLHVRAHQSASLRAALRTCWDKYPDLIASLGAYSDVQLTQQFTGDTDPAFKDCMKAKGWLDVVDAIPGP